MAVELEDPLADCFLLPRTVSLAFPGTDIHAGESRGSDLIGNLIDSLAVKGSAELVKQAVTISKDSWNMLALQSVNEVATVIDNDQGRPHGRRPGMGRKRAQFSLRLPSSDTSSTVKVAYNIDHIEDPDEYFLAIERHENAERELKKLKGDISSDLFPHNIAEARKRRPGILGKKASFKHHLTPVESDVNLLTSQMENSAERITSPINSDIAELSNLLPPRETSEIIASASKETDKVVLYDGANVEGSAVHVEKNVDNLIFELVNSFDELNARNEVGFLQEKLQIRSIDFGKLHLPEIISYQDKESQSESSKIMQRKLRVSQKPHDSSTKTKNLLSSFATLQRRVSLTHPVSDLYSMHSTDSPQCSSEMEARPSTTQKKNHDLNDSTIDSSPVLENISESSFQNLQSPDITVDDVPLYPNISGGRVESSLLFSERQTVPASAVPYVDADSTFGTVDGCMDNEGNDIQRDASASIQLETGGKDLSPADTSHAMQDGFSRQTNASPEISEVHLNSSSSEQRGSRHGIHNAGDGLSGFKEVSKANDIDGAANDSGHDKSISSVNPVLHSPALHSDNSVLCNQNNEIPNPSIAAKTVLERRAKRRAPSRKRKNEKVDYRRQSLRDISNLNQDHLPMDRNEKTSCTEVEENNESRAPSESHGMLPDEMTNQLTLPPKKKNKNDLSRRQSLGGAGTKMEDGVRRSTRIKSRPLKYWCGERFVYGRIHDSLATVIGVKYASPGGSNLKVKSYVSTKYADMVANSALH